MRQRRPSQAYARCAVDGSTPGWRMSNRIAFKAIAFPSLITGRVLARGPYLVEHVSGEGRAVARQLNTEYRVFIRVVGLKDEGRMTADADPF